MKKMSDAQDTGPYPVEKGDKPGNGAEDNWRDIDEHLAAQK